MVSISAEIKKEVNKIFKSHNLYLCDLLMKPGIVYVVNCNHRQQPFLHYNYQVIRAVRVNESVC